MADIQKQPLPNPVAQAITRLDGLSETVRRLYDRGVRVSSSTLARWRSQAFVDDVRALFALADLSGVDPRGLGGQSVATPDGTGPALQPSPTIPVAAIAAGDGSESLAAADTQARGAEPPAKAARRARAGHLPRSSGWSARGRRALRHATLPLFRGADVQAVGG
jgi:hypothetical protein